MRCTAIVMLALALVACGGPAEQDASIELLLVGVDGLDWTVALRLLREGRMPQLRSLIDRSVAGLIATIAPAKSPVIWTSIATGKAPAEHGILDFITDADGGEQRLFTSADRRTKALWNILDDAGRRSIVVSWWNSFPAEPIEGVVVAQANTLEQISLRRMLKPGGLLEEVPDQVHPASRQQEMLAIAREVDREMPALLETSFGDIGRATNLADRANLDSCAWSVRADESSRRIALRLAAEPEGASLLAVYFGTPDVVSHRFWRFHEPEAFDHPPGDAAIAQFGEVVVDAYAAFDAMLGDLLAAVGGGTDVVVLSDHGMHAYNTGSRFDRPVNGRLERESGGHEDGPPGMLVAAGPSFRQGTLPGPLDALHEADLPSLGHVLDVAPTLLALLELPVGGDMQGRVLEELLSYPPAVRRIDTHDDEAWLASRPDAAPFVPGTEERLEQLRSLGYIGGDTTEEKP